MDSVLPVVQGFMYPNEIELQWGVLVVLYPFVTGLVAGAFILASLERVFNVEAVKPTYRLALLTALAFLLVAPLPLQLHLGHPERSLEMYLTPHTESAMAMFGFVYLWYLMVVLVLEIWLDYRKEIVLTWRESTRPEAVALRGHGALVGQHQPGGARARRSDRPHADRHRDPFRVPAARLRRVHLRFGEGQSVVVHAADADRLPVLGDRIGHRGGHARLHGHLLVAQAPDRHGVPRHRGALPLLRIRHRLFAGDARPHPPNLRSGRVVPGAGLHGAHAAVHLADRRADHPGHPRAALHAGRGAAAPGAGESAAVDLRGRRHADR